MKLKLQRITNLCGSSASFYTVVVDGSIPIWARFIEGHKPKYLTELMNMVGRIKTMAESLGATENFFKPSESSNPLDKKVVAFYDIPNSRLRLYCIRMSDNLVILGGGGPKPTWIRAWQDSKQLTKEVELVMIVSELIDKKIASGDLGISGDGLSFTGTLEIS